MHEMIKWLSRHGFLTIYNSSAGMFLTDHLMRWFVRLEIRLPNGITIEERGDDLEGVLSIAMVRAAIWYEKNRPRYLDEENVVAHFPEVTDEG